MGSYSHTPSLPVSDTEVGGHKKHSILEPHLRVMLYGKDGQTRYNRKGFSPRGLLSVGEVQDRLDSKVKKLPWEKDIKQPHRREEFTSSGAMVLRARAHEEKATVKEVDKYARYNKMLKKYFQDRIGFVGISLHGEPMPPWVVARMDTACKSARYELPSNRQLLETMSPLQYLANYTRLYREQNRRYTQLFKNFKGNSDCLSYQRLYPALNSMYGNCLNEENFHILCTVLFIDKDSIFDLVTFVGICTYCDRLFWTAFLEMENRESLHVWGPNRTSLEFVDFENLRWKLRGLDIPMEMTFLLYSLS